MIHDLSCNDWDYNYVDLHGYVGFKCTCLCINVVEGLKGFCGDFIKNEEERENLGVIRRR